MYFLLFIFFATTQSFVLRSTKTTILIEKKRPFFGNLGSWQKGRPGFGKNSRIGSWKEDGRPGFGKNSRIGSRKGSWNGFLKLIRAQNILPTFFLSFTGAVIQKNLWSAHFVTSSLATLGILSSSMVFNDLFDMPIDKINHPNRPLINGDVSVKEALYYAASFVAITESITHFMTPRMRHYVRFSLMGVILYTPVLKRIPLVKNLFCASLVSLALGFSGNADSVSPILACATQHIFAGSLHNELLLDIRDRQGDAQHGIATIPVLFGNKVALLLATHVLVINLVRLTYVLTWQKTLPLLLICLPMFRNIRTISLREYNRDVVVKASKETSIPLFLSLLYFIIIAHK
jgi:geranylgeranylglycerol-phosphate geranylgeranyltransferase